MKRILICAIFILAARVQAAEPSITTYELNDGRKINAVRVMATELDGVKNYKVTTVTGKLLSFTGAEVKSSYTNTEFAEAYKRSADWTARSEKLEYENTVLTKDKEDAQARFNEHDKRLNELRAQRDKASTNAILNSIEEERKAVESIRNELAGLTGKLTENEQARTECGEYVAYCALMNNKTADPVPNTVAASKEELRKDYLREKAKLLSTRDAAAKELAAAQSRYTDVVTIIYKQTAAADPFSDSGGMRASPELFAEARALPAKISALKERVKTASAMLEKLETKWQEANAKPDRDPFELRKNKKTAAE